MSDTISAKAVAAACDTTGKRIRSFIRNAAEKGSPVTTADGVEIMPVGSGASYAFSRSEAVAIIAAFAKRPATADRRSAAVVKADVMAWLDSDAFASEDEDADDDDDEDGDA